jgi:hypothetical protein
MHLPIDARTIRPQWQDHVMDELKLLESLGLALPGPAYLFGMILFSVIGLAAYRYGKRAASAAARWLGIALMLYPYAVSETWLLYLVGTLLCIAWVVVHRRLHG